MKPADVIQTEADAVFRGIVGDSAGTNVDGTIPLDSDIGQFITLLTDGFSGLWELLQAIYSSRDPSGAVDESLDEIGALRGVPRENPKFSTVTETCTGDPGTILTGPPTPRVVTVIESGSRFDSLEAATIAALPAWIGVHAYAAGARVTHVSRAYLCITSGTSSVFSGPSTTLADITDGTVHWRYLGEGTGAVDVPYQAEVAGPIGALSGLLTGIATPITGWKSAINVLDAVAGALEESNPAYRARQDAELVATGEAVPDAIRAHVLVVAASTSDPVTSCQVFFNDSDLTDANGIPPHSVMAVVEGGPADTTPAGSTTDPAASIASALWNSVAAGIGTFGNTSVTVQDEEGNDQVIEFYRPADANVYVHFDIVYDVKAWPTVDTVALIEQAVISAVLTYADDPSSYPPGKDVFASILAAAVKFGPQFVDSDGDAVVPAPPGSTAMPGIWDVEAQVGTSPGPSGSSVGISVFQIAKFDSSRFTFSLVTGLVP